MIILLDIPNPAGGNRALVMTPSDTMSGWELYKVLYSPEKGETIDGVEADHVTFIAQSWVPSLLHAAVEEMTHWGDATGEGPESLAAFVARLDDWMKRMEAGLPSYSTRN